VIARLVAVESSFFLLGLDLSFSCGFGFGFGFGVCELDEVDIQQERSLIIGVFTFLKPCIKLRPSHCSVFELLESHIFVHACAGKSCPTILRNFILPLLGGEDFPNEKRNSKTSFEVIPAFASILTTGEPFVIAKQPIDNIEDGRSVDLAFVLQIFEHGVHSEESTKAVNPSLQRLIFRGEVHLAFPGIQLVLFAFVFGVAL